MLKRESKKDWTMLQKKSTSRYCNQSDAQMNILKKKSNKGSPTTGRQYEENPGDTNSKIK